MPFNGEPEEFVGVEISLKPNSVDTRLRSADGTWQRHGAGHQSGRDFTQGKVGVLVPGNDEVGVSTVPHREIESRILITPSLSNPLR